MVKRITDWWSDLNPYTQDRLGIAGIMLGIIVVLGIVVWLFILAPLIMIPVICGGLILAALGALLFKVAEALWDAWF